MSLEDQNIEANMQGKWKVNGWESLGGPDMSTYNPDQQTVERWIEETIAQNEGFPVSEDLEVV